MGLGQAQASRKEGFQNSDERPISAYSEYMGLFADRVQPGSDTRAILEPCTDATCKTRFLPIALLYGPVMDLGRNRSLAALGFAVPGRSPGGFMDSANR
jgi:hypothetical protein